MTDVSVIIPAYNTDAYIHKCIQSALTQAVDLEVLLVNDGSTDNTGRICDFYASRDSRIKVIHQENLGQGPARNKALDIAVGKYVYFLDSDDYLYQNALEILLDVSKRHTLDICAPASPSHYYNRPFENISCLPSRMQFIRRSLLEKYKIRQPLSRSGQDGVFSHEVLCFARNFGIAHDARLHYRPNRVGSTFQHFRGKPELAKMIVESHYSHLSRRYMSSDEAFISRNAVRLLTFIGDETLKNRVYPHIRFLTTETVAEIIGSFRELGLYCLARITKNQRAAVLPSVIACLQRDPMDAAKMLARDYSQVELRSVTLSKDTWKSKDENVTLCSTDISKSKVSENKQSTGPTIDLLKRQSDYALNVTNQNLLLQRASLLLQHGPTGIIHSEAPVASMTTIPSRLATLHYPLYSILTQTIQPKKIVVWLDDKFEFKVEKYPALHRLLDFGVEFVQVPDVGPHTKLYYSLSKYRDELVVTFDDDMMYPENALEQLLKGYSKHPDCVVANWARMIPAEAELNKNGIRSGKLLTPPQLEVRLEENDSVDAEPIMGAIAYGTGGVLYPKGSLNNHVLDLHLMRELCPTEDDVWYRVMAILNGTKLVTTKLGINPSHFSVFTSQGEALRYINHGRGSNVTQLINTFRFFHIFDILERVQ